MTEFELVKFSNPKCDNAYTNYLYLNKKNKFSSKYVEVSGFVFPIKYKSFVPLGKVITNNCNRIQLGVTYNQKIVVKEYLGEKLENIKKLDILITTLNENSEKYSNIDFKILLDSLNLTYITKTQDFIGKIGDNSFKIHINKIISDTELKRGKYTKFTELIITVDKINLVEKIDKVSEPVEEMNIININLLDHGIGGMDNEFKNMIREVFLSRTLDPETFSKLGIKHQKGIIIHGPSGVGKTTLARVISSIVTNIKPIIVNGPEILNKFVGKSEENIRDLFKDAEAEFKLKGIYSDLHVIIFDEIDAIARKRNIIPNGTNGVANNVVNQLLTKIDGIEKIDNILVIGITNRFELLDEAILRPGRFGVHIEIPLPNFEGRQQIFSIHTRGLIESGIISNDVDIKALVHRTKNFTGAEIENLIQKAASYAIERDTHINQDDFIHALSEIIPKYGNTPVKLPTMFMYNRSYITLIKELGDYISNFNKNKYLNFSTILVEGSIGSGKTTLVSKLVSESDFSFTRVINSEKLITFHNDHAKTMYIYSIFKDSEKSDKSVIFLDNLEHLLEKNVQGVSKDLLHTFLTLVSRKPENTKLLIIATTSSKDCIRNLGLLELFDMLFSVPNIENSDIPNIISTISVAQAKSMFPPIFTIKDLLTVLGNTEQYKVDQACQKYFYRYKTQID